MKLYDSLAAANIRIQQLEAALIKLHGTAQGGIFRCGNAPGIPNSRVLSYEVLPAINLIMFEVLGADHDALKYYNDPRKVAIEPAVQKTK